MSAVPDARPIPTATGNASTSPSSGGRSGRRRSRRVHQQVS